MVADSAVTVMVSTLLYSETQNSAALQRDLAGLVASRHVPLFQNLAEKRPVATLAAAIAEWVAVQLGLIAERENREWLKTAAVCQKF